jgi:hypothetical protein
LCARHVLIQPDCTVVGVGTGRPNMALPCGLRVIYDIFEGTAEIQQLVITRAISGIQIN